MAKGRILSGRSAGRVIGVEEAKTFDGLRWWAPGELQATAEAFAPADLPALVEQLIEQRPPEHPLEVGN